MKKQQNDNELLYLIYQNDEDAKKLLYEKYKAVLHGLTKKMYERCKTINGTEYEDFYQEACYGFEKAIVSFDEQKEILFYTYVISCVKNQLLCYRRNITRKKDAPLNTALYLQEEVEEGLEYEDLLQSSEMTPYEVCEEQEEIFRIKQFQNSLSFLEACIFELRYNGFQYKEIASLLDITHHRVSYGLQRIKSKATFLS